MTAAKIAITHASGLLAEALLVSLAESGVEPDSVVLLDVTEQAGNRLAYGDTYITVIDQYEYDYEGLLAVYLLQADTELKSLLQHADCYLISHHVDDSIAPVDFLQEYDSFSFATQADQVNLPNAEQATLLSVIRPIQAQAPLASVQVVNILSASLYGQAAVEELASQTIALLNSREISSAALPMQLAFNMVPVSTAQDKGEILQQLLQSGSIQCAVQDIMVAAFHGLAIAVQLEFQKDQEFNHLEQLVKGIPGVVVTDGMVSPVTQCQSGSDIFVCGLSQPQKDAKRLQFWIIADSIRNGLVKNYQKVTDILINSYL